MSTDPDAVEFDAVVTLALAHSAALTGGAPRPVVKQLLLARLTNPAVPAGFAFRIPCPASG
jgi:hypothetical protein